MRPQHQQSLIEQFAIAVLNNATDSNRGTEAKIEGTAILDEEVSTVYSTLAEEQTSFSLFRIATDPLGLLLALYKPEYESQICALLEKGAKVTNRTLLFIFRIADRISNDVLTKLLATHDEEITSPIIRKKNIFLIAANQQYVNILLLDHLIRTKKLDPTVHYTDPKTQKALPSGVELATSSENFSLLAYYQKRSQTSIATPSETLIVELGAHEAVTFATRDDAAPSEEKFSESVKAFKKAHGIKSLRKWLTSPEDHGFTLLQSLFFTRKDVAAFLLRETVTLTGNVPDYPKHERSIYAGIEAKEKLGIPFRSDQTALSKEEAKASSKKIGGRKQSAGTSGAASKFMIDVLLKNLSFSTNIKILNILDIYQIETRLLLLEHIQFSANNGLVYFINLGGKDSHSFASLSILDTALKQIKLHIFVNSWINPEYISYLRIRINYLRNRHEDLKSVPVFDASLQIQTTSNDGFCGTYSLEICRALYFSLLEDSALEKALGDFAQKSERTESDWEPLKQQLQTAVKQRMPMFYQTEKGEIKERAPEERIGWHIQNRFQYGRLFLRQKIAETEKRIQADKRVIQGLGCNNSSSR